MGQKGRSLLFEHWRPGDESRIESGRAIFAGEVTAAALPDESRGHGGALDFDVTADGQRVLAVTPARAESSSISLLLNWPALLHK